MTKKKTTKPPHNPTDAERHRVKTMTGMGIVQDDICEIIGISKPTLRKYYRHEIDTGSAEANAAVAQSLFKQATNKDKPNVVAAIFWLKARAGWRDQDSTSTGKKQEKQEAAEKASKGKFAPTAPPQLKQVK